MYENLESTFKQEYPKFEIIFSVADENDQALSVVRELMCQYPNVDAKISIGVFHLLSLPLVKTYLALQARRWLVSIPK